MQIWKKILHFFDKLEDHIRGFLSHYPVPYSLLGGVCIVIFWKGVWDIAEKIPLLKGEYGGYIEVLFSTIILLSTGLFVSFFIGDTIILSGIRKEKKLAEKEQAEIENEMTDIEHFKTRLTNIEKILLEVRDKIK